MNNIGQLHYFIGKLKKVNRRLISNMFMSEEELHSYIERGRLRYLFCPGKYLNIWYKERGVIRLFFYIADLNAYEPIESDVPIICDLFFSKYSKQADLLVETLRNAGFEQYASYHKWMRGTDMAFSNYKREKVYIYQEQAKDFFELLKENFDIYSDNIPEEEKAEQFLHDRICYSAYLGNKSDFAGGMVITSHGRVQIEDFIFVLSGQRRNGVASALHSYWYEKNKELDVLFVSWIRDDNEASIKLHQKYHYVKQETYKISMKRSKR